MMFLEREVNEQNTGMDCRECGADGAALVEVEFTDGSLREIPLCDDCRDAYRDGTLVDEVEND